ncbi:hypothetical protein BJ944DRAFT_273872 [Cunninghamella echinulata]|nr:hypothetical protein BJ944DRAFT_273872 [Cunninghamella echinulata]
MLLSYRSINNSKVQPTVIQFLNFRSLKTSSRSTFRHETPLKNKESISQATTTVKSSTCCHSKKNTNSAAISLFTKEFWMDNTSWQRTRINTFRCLIGCTSGDFSMMWYLQYNYPDLSPMVSTSAAMAAGLTTSLLLETVLLKRTMKGITYQQAFKTAMGMSFASMLAMELAENAVDWHLMGGVVDFSEPKFWMAAATSMLAGYLVPLPYNYWRLKALGKSCH